MSRALVTRTSPGKAALAPDWAALLRDHGLRATSAAIAILDHLHGADRPLTHAELVARMARRKTPRVDRATLYRALDRLTQVGLLSRFPGPDGTARFGMPSPEAQAYFECNGCHSVVALAPGALPPDLVEHLRGEMLRQGIASAQISLAITGTCRACSAAGETGVIVVAVRSRNK